ncbi:MAG: hypothetical protein IKS01_04235 [Paludibacteraceae bacterium]|nr:hypothetical protein [Paludibacteraceae bacterium]
MARVKQHPVSSIFSEKAQSLFAEYPNITKVYFTSDKMAFFEEREAQAHACVLKDESITTIQK